MLMRTFYSPDIAGVTFLVSCNSSCTMHSHSESRQVAIFSNSVQLLFPGGDGISELQMLQFESLSEVVR